MTSPASERRCGTCAAVPELPAKFCAMCGAQLASVTGQEATRRHVVVLFADLAGFTPMSERLDPEALRAVMDKYFGLVSQIVWDHGGATEKFIGDAVMAVFGMPLVSEDDALRAVQAALAIAAGLDALSFPQDTHARVNASATRSSA